MRFHTVEKQKKRHRLFQDHTVLAYYSMEDGSYHKDETEVDSNDVVRVLKKFTRSPLGGCDGAGYLNVTPDQTLFRELRFFLPLFIWSYNWAKQTLEIHDAEVRRLQGFIQRDEQLIRNTLTNVQASTSASDQPAPVPEAPSHFE